MQGTGAGPDTPARLLGRLQGAARAHPALSVAVIACLAGAVLLAWSAFHKSDRGKVQAVLEAIGEAMVEGDEEKVMAHVSPYFSEEGMYRDQLAERLARILPGRPVSRISLVVRQLNIGHGTATAMVYVESRHGDPFRGQFARTEWLVTVEELGDRWLVRHVTPLELNGRKVAGLRAIMALGY